MEWMRIIYGLNICALILGFFCVLIGWKFEFFAVAVLGMVLTMLAGTCEFCCFFTAESTEELNLFLDSLIIFMFISFPFVGYIFFHLIFREKEGGFL